MNKIVSSVEDSHAARSEPSVFKDKPLNHEAVCLEEVIDRQRAQRQHELVGFIRILNFPDFIVKTFVCGNPGACPGEEQTSSADYVGRTSKLRAHSMNVSFL